jgi:hypothetical protein
MLRDWWSSTSAVRILAGGGRMQSDRTLTTASVGSAAVTSMNVAENCVVVINTESRDIPNKKTKKTKQKRYKTKRQNRQERERR